LNVDVAGALTALAVQRPVFHSERDFQHALAWQIQLASPQAHIRLETRPRRGVHLDILVRLDGKRTAIEVKYLVARVLATVGGEVFDLPHQSANDISRHDVIKDITRIEAVLDGCADHGCVLVLSNDRSYWQSATRADPIDPAFRLHEGRVLQGSLAWAARAGKGTTAGRGTPLLLTGRYTCHLHDYSQVNLSNGQVALFCYLLMSVTRGQASSPTEPDPAAGLAEPQPHSPARPPSPAAPPSPGSARQEILAAARKLAGRSPDRSFALMDIVAELRRSGSRYAESTIRTHVTSRMCADAPDHHGTTYDDLVRLGGGRYRLRRY